MASTSRQSELDRAWREHHRVARDVAYRLLGSVVEAEDAVQEAYVRLARQPEGAVDDVRAWLVVVVSRICLDFLGSARVMREAYIGPWLPEPIVEMAATGGGGGGTAGAGVGARALEAVGAAGSSPLDDPAQRVTLDDSVRMALLVVLEQLTPAERVAFVLHDVFQLPYGEIGEIVGRRADACRQLASRARRRIAPDAEAAGAEPVDAEQERKVTERFLAACAGGDLDALAAELDPDVLLRADGGGRVQAPRRPVRGRDVVVKIVANGLRNFPGLTVSGASVNGGPGGVVRLADGTLAGVLAFTVRESRIVGIELLANPDKLARLGLA
ncbi:MAG TPA: RNA polymerase sigma factor SigJ [Conexibacter sp.]